MVLNNVNVTYLLLQTPKRSKSTTLNLSWHHTKKKHSGAQKSPFQSYTFKKAALPLLQHWIFASPNSKEHSDSKMIPARDPKQCVVRIDSKSRIDSKGKGRKDQTYPKIIKNHQWLQASRTRVTLQVVKEWCSFKVAEKMESIHDIPHFQTHPIPYGWLCKCIIMYIRIHTPYPPKNDWFYTL